MSEPTLFMLCCRSASRIAIVTGCQRDSMGQILKHPARVKTFSASDPPDRTTVRLFEMDGHIRPMIEIEADLISLALRLNAGSLGKTARDLGINRATLYRRLLNDR